MRMAIGKIFSGGLPADGILRDSSARPAVDLNNRQLLKTNGDPLELWGTGFCRDAFGNSTFDLLHGLIYDGLTGPSVLSLNAVSRLLKDKAGNTVVNWANQSASAFTGGSVTLVDSGGNTFTLLNADPSAGIANFSISMSSNLTANWANGFLCMGTGMILAAGGIDIGSGGLFGFKSSATWYGGARDLGIKRLSAGLLGISDGGSGKGNLDANSLTVPGTSGATLIVTANTTAPATLAAAATANVYGAANGKVLGDPVDWLLVSVNGTNRKIPVY